MLNISMIMESNYSRPHAQSPVPDAGGPWRAAQYQRTREPKMYCIELDRLLDQHSALTMRMFRQDGVTQGWFHTVEEWEQECKKLRAMEEELERLNAQVAAHRRQHGCDVEVLATAGTKEHEGTLTGRARV